MSKEIKTDVLIIGSGIAGLFSAIKIADFADVLVITKKGESDSNTNYAQGGIASVMSKVDSYEKHINDTLIAGAGLCNRKAVEILVKEGPDRIKDLMAIGTKFTEKQGHLDLAKEGGHSVARIVHAKDLTGREVERALIANVKSHKNILVKENYFAIDFLTEHNVLQLKQMKIENRNCWGVYALDKNTNEVVKIIANITILASGGLGQVYLHTTNPSIATGDGFAMAYRAGARMANMEFIQFHPTALYEPQTNNSKDKRTFLISEAVRGFGGRLMTKAGDYFMERYDERKDLAPRDIVARAIDNELKKSGDQYVLLDVTHKPAKEIIDHFPNIYKTCLDAGIDMTKEPIPVVPAAHYACGGVVVDECSSTSINGLFACGEVTMTGVHGANRLASNSLLEALVFANRAAIKIKDILKTRSTKIPGIPDWDDSGTLTADEKILITHNFKEVKQTMWDYVGIVRSNKRLERAAKRIQTVFEEMEEFYKRTKVFTEILELRNLIATAHIIIKSARMRKESRGLHYTIDYPETDDSKPAENTVIQNKNI